VSEARNVVPDPELLARYGCGPIRFTGHNDKHQQAEHRRTDANTEKALQPGRHIGGGTRTLDQGDQHAQRELRSKIADPFPSDLDGVADPDAGTQGDHQGGEFGAEKVEAQQRDRAAEQASQRPVGHPFIDGLIAPLLHHDRGDHHDEVRGDGGL
jgi:hypothetical protein